MILRNLRYLDALALEKHFARAAAACQVTQPTLSAGIKQLEEELGLLIVQRGQRFEGLTLEGERVLLWARRILADCESLRQEASELRAGLSGRLRLGVIPTALPAVAQLTAPFAQRHPLVSISVLSLSSIEIQRGLDDFSLDAGITYLENEPLTHVRSIPLYHERYYLFTSASGPLAHQSEVSWSDAAQVPLCLLTPDMQNRRILDSLFKAEKVQATPVIETNSVLTIWSHVQSGRWSSILPQAFLPLFADDSDVEAIPLATTSGHYSIGVVVPDRDPVTPSARELAAVAESVELGAPFRLAVKR
jgi:DNA-binding transcriptional LysR family regulator